ncbi:siderophore ABC transporter substrate-binding protein [Oceanicola sp. S124]|uniref:siderophore ABC transporter substrate-binding protein n=1 Tax=Oceanicola sp. S124 TaxID=1042378 RepID=UPI0002559A1B|nr:siderophore ABC transporter substrate-binding protein [Oceanicola sp. S124]
MTRIATLALSAFLGLSTAAAAETVTVQTYPGPAKVETGPASTIVYDLAALDTLDALGVAGLTSISNTYLDYLAGYAGDAGSLFEPDFEAVNAAEPDLVIVGGRSQPHLQDMARIAPAIDMTIWGADVIEQGLARLEAYGQIWGMETKAAALKAEVEQAIAATRAAAEGKGSALILLTNGPKISVYGSGSRFGWLHDLTGLTEAAGELKAETHGEAVSFEYVRDLDPDWLLVIDRVAAIGGEGENARATLDNALIRETKAWRAGQVVFLDAGPIYIAGGGVQSTLMTLETLRAGLEGQGS